MYWKELKQLLDENPEQKELIKKAIDAYEKGFSYRNNCVCSICDVELTDDEKQMTPLDFLHTCTAHKPYRRYFHVDAARAELGIKPRNDEVLIQLMNG